MILNVGAKHTEVLEVNKQYTERNKYYGKKLKGVRL